MKDESTGPRADASSIDAMWAAFAEPLRRFLVRRVGNDADADDLLQIVFTKIHSGIGALADSERLPAWIFQIARRTLIDHFRSRASAPGFVDLPEDLADDAEPVAALSELAECVRPMIDQLPEPYRQALTFTELQGRTQRELARALKLSVSGAKTRVQRGREQLKALLLACCHVEVDRRGGVVDYEPRQGCAGCSRPTRS
ncbi:MAG: RNA polymerase sigma factor SigZ [Nitrospirota bacterium]